MRFSALGFRFVVVGDILVSTAAAVTVILVFLMLVSLMMLLADVTLADVTLALLSLSFTAAGTGLRTACGGEWRRWRLLDKLEPGEKRHPLPSTANGGGTDIVSEQKWHLTVPPRKAAVCK